MAELSLYREKKVPTSPSNHANLGRVIGGYSFSANALLRFWGTNFVKDTHWSVSTRLFSWGILFIFLEDPNATSTIVVVLPKTLSTMWVMLSTTCSDKLSKKVEKLVEYDPNESESEDTSNTSFVGSLTLKPDSSDSLEQPSDEPIIPIKYKCTWQATKKREVIRLRERKISKGEKLTLPTPFYRG